MQTSSEMAPDPAAALAWGRRLHAGQLYGDRPYAVHLDAVAGVLRRFGHGDDPALMSAGYLHDTIEDQGVTREEIAARFGERVAGIVDAVSDPPGRSRHEQKAAAYPRIRALGDAVVVKLADRIANVEAGGPKVEMYRGEQAGFSEVVHEPGVADDMWAHLDALLSPAAAPAG